MRRTLASEVNELSLADLLKKGKEIWFFLRKWLTETMNLSQESLHMGK